MSMFTENFLDAPLLSIRLSDNFKKLISGFGMKHKIPLIKDAGLGNTGIPLGTSGNPNIYS